MAFAIVGVARVINSNSFPSVVVRYLYAVCIGASFSSLFLTGWGFFKSSFGLIANDTARH